MSFCHVTVFHSISQKGKDIVFSLVFLLYVQPSFPLSSCYHVHLLHHPLFLPHGEWQVFYHQETEEIGLIYIWVTSFIKLPYIVTYYLKCCAILYTFYQSIRPTESAKKAMFCQYSLQFFLRYLKNIKLRLNIPSGNK